MGRVSFKSGNDVDIQNVPYAEGSIYFLRDGSNGTIYADVNGSRARYTNEAYDDSQIRNMISALASDIDILPRMFIETSELPSTVNVTADASYTYESPHAQFSGDGTLRCKDTNSANYPKKDYILTLEEDEDVGWGNVSQILLRSNYVDHTHFRNIINSKIWSEMVESRSDYNMLPTELKQSVNNGTTDGFPIKVYVNGIYQGIYTLCAVQGANEYGMSQAAVSSGTQFVLRGRENTGTTPADTATNFRVSTTAKKMVDRVTWEVMVGMTSTASVTAYYLTPINDLINFISTTTDETTFKAGIGDYLYIWSAIDYYLFAYAICGLNMLGKYQTLLCYDGQKFIFTVEDTDATYGLYWNGTSIVSATYKCPQEYEETNNLLFQRIEDFYKDELYYRWLHLRENELSYYNIISKAENFWYSIGLEIYDEDYNSTPYTLIPSRNLTDITQVRDYIANRLAYVDTQMLSFKPPEPCERVTLNTNEATIPAGFEVSLTATTVPVRTTEQLVWSISDNSVATLSVSGKECVVTGTAEGIATVTATCGSYSASCVVNVTGNILEEHVLAENYSPNGSSFIYTAPISLTDSQFIEISIDLSGVNIAKENVVSIGQDIGSWKGNYPHMHVYVSSATKTREFNLDVNSSSGYVRTAVALNGSSSLVIRLDENGIVVNGNRLTGNATWTSIVNDILALSSYDIGSQEGINRSHATYYYIKYYSLSAD